MPSVTASSLPANRRWAVRRKTCAPGTVRLVASGHLLSGTIIDMSASGAQVECYRPLPALESHARAVLVFTMDSAEIECLIVRSIGRRMGLKFTGPLSQVARTTKGSAARPTLLTRMNRVTHSA